VDQGRLVRKVFKEEEEEEIKCSEKNELPTTP